MYKNKKILAIIPARGGSKGIKNKNIIALAGKPLIAYTIEAAINSRCFDDIIVSTDSDRIATIAREFGASVPFLRPAELASDESKGEDVSLHAVKFMLAHGKNYDLCVYLQPTSPLRNSGHIREALDFLIDHNLPSLTTVSEASEHPIFMRTIDANGKMSKILDIASNIRRQDLNPYYILNGAIYINCIDDILTKHPGNDNSYGFIMDSESGIDINTMEDLKIVEHIMNRENK